MAANAAIIGAVASGVGAAGSIIQGKKASKAQEKAQEKQQRIADLQAQRARVKTIREGRIRRAEIIAGGAEGGTTGSSGVAGGVGAVTQGVAGNLAFGQQVQGLAGEASAANIEAAQAQSTGATFGAIGGVGQNIFEQARGLKTLFKE
jgi:hypothetical protein